MSFAPLAASAGSATAAAAAPATVALPATMPGSASSGTFCEYFVAQSGGDFCMKMLFQSLPGTSSCDVLWQRLGELSVLCRRDLVYLSVAYGNDTSQGHIIIDSFASDLVSRTWESIHEQCQWPAKFAVGRYDLRNGLGEPTTTTRASSAWTPLERNTRQSSTSRCGCTATSHEPQHGHQDLRFSLLPCAFLLRRQRASSARACVRWTMRLIRL